MPPLRLTPDEPQAWRASPALGPGRGRSLRIAQVTEYYHPHVGGVCEHVHFFAREARHRGHHVDVITSRIGGAAASTALDRGDPFRGERGRVLRVGRSLALYANGSHARTTISPGIWREMRRVLRDGRYDIVHVHAPLVPVLPTVAIDEADCPVVGTFHAFHGRSFGYAVFRPYLRPKLERLAAAIAVSHAAAACVARYFDTSGFRIVPNGVDTSLFTPFAPRPAAIPESDAPTVLFLGRFDPRNGLGTLLRAFRAVRGPRRPARLVVVGDGPLRAHYHRLAAATPGVHFAGGVGDAERPGYYAHSAVYACPATRGSFGITLLEAMACGTPPVCSDISGFAEVVRHEREALRFAPDDEGALADALVRVLDDDTLRQRMADAGLERAARYDWARVGDEILGVYGAVLGVAEPPRARARA